MSPNHTPHESVLAAARRAERKTVIGLHLEFDGLMRAVLEEIKERDWVPLDLTLTGAGTLARITPQVAAVDVLNPRSVLSRELIRLNCPLVSYGVSGDAESLNPDWPAVLRDFDAEARVAARHFAERGFKDVGYVGSDPWSGFRALYERFDVHARDADCTCHLLQFKSSKIGDPKETQYERRLALFKEWIESVPKPIGILSWGYKGGAILCEMCQHLGLSVPEDVAVLVASEDTVRNECAPVPLSCMGVDYAAIAQAVVTLLDDALAGREVSKAPVLIAPPPVTCRASTDVLATRNPDLARALRFIWQHYDLDLGVDQIAEAVGVPSRSLQRMFKQELGRGVNAELRRKRLERTCELLLTTDLTIENIAHQVGIQSKDYLHAAFRRRYGMTPRAFRVKEGGGED